MNIIMHGAGQEIGRSCIEVQWHDKRILFDAGIKIGEEQNEYPTPVDDIEHIDALFLSHAHMDHCGAIPFLVSQGLNCPIFCTDVTKELSLLMLKDAWKVDRIEKRPQLYERKNIRLAVDGMRSSTKGKHMGISYEFIASGHIPGSASILLTYKGESLLYSGDINSVDTRLLKPHKNLPYADVLIIESTYGCKGHKDRHKVEDDFAQAIMETLDRGGSAVIAVFAVGRSQEILLQLSTLPISCPIYLDGLSKLTTKIFLKYPRELRDKTLAQMMKKVQQVTSWDRRSKITKSQGVFVATSGMLEGGPVMSYLADLGKDAKNAMILTGYQAENSNGRMLLDKKCIEVDGKVIPVKSAIHHFDFSAHAGQEGLQAIIDQVKPRFVITNHGEAESAKALAAYAKKKGCTSYAPKTGEGIELPM